MLHAWKAGQEVDCLGVAVAVVEGDVELEAFAVDAGDLDQHGFDVRCPHINHISWLCATD